MTVREKGRETGWLGKLGDCKREKVGRQGVYKREKLHIEKNLKTTTCKAGRQGVVIVTRLLNE